MASSNVTRINKPPLYVLGFTSIFIVNKTLEINEVKVPWIISSYLDDFLFLPLALWFTKVIIKIFKDENFNFKPGHYIFIWLYISVMFEFIIPKWKPYFVSDFYDIFAYGLGILLYIVIEKFRLSRK